jgi:hypothetical protein
MAGFLGILTFEESEYMYMADHTIDRQRCTDLGCFEPLSHWQ